MHKKPYVRHTILGKITFFLFFMELESVFFMEFERLLDCIDAFLHSNDVITFFSCGGIFMKALTRAMKKCHPEQVSAKIDCTMRRLFANFPTYYDVDYTQNK